MRMAASASACAAGVLVFFKGAVKRQAPVRTIVTSVAAAAAAYWSAVAGCELYELFRKQRANRMAANLLASLASVWASLPNNGPERGFTDVALNTARFRSLLLKPSIGLALDFAQSVGGKRGLNLTAVFPGCPPGQVVRLAIRACMQYDSNRGDNERLLGFLRGTDVLSETANCNLLLAEVTMYQEGRVASVLPYMRFDRLWPGDPHGLVHWVRSAGSPDDHLLTICSQASDDYLNEVVLTPLGKRTSVLRAAVAGNRARLVEALIRRFPRVSNRRRALG